MKIWLVQRAESTPHDDNGARRLMRMGILADLMQSKGHSVVWWTSSFDHVQHAIRHKNSKRVPVKENYDIHYLKCFGYKNNKSLSRLIDNKVVASHFSKESAMVSELPDVILVSMPSVELAQHAVRFAKKHNIPVYLDIRDLWPDVFREMFPRYLSWLVDLATIPMRSALRQVCRDSTAIVGITDEFVKWGVAHGGRQPGERDIHFPMAYVKNKVCQQDFDAASDFWNSLGVIQEGANLYVLFLGTFTKSFDFDTIFSAAELLQKQNAGVKFIFCGVGSKEEQVRSNCSKLNNCIFAGWVNAAQIHVALKMADVGLAPYIETPNFIDNIPNKPAEYMSEGLAVASSLKKGALFKLLTENKCGFTYGSDSKALAQTLSYYSENKNELTKLQKTAHRVFKTQFDGIRIYERMIHYLENSSKFH